MCVVYPLAFTSPIFHLSNSVGTFELFLTLCGKNDKAKHVEYISFIRQLVVCTLIKAKVLHIITTIHTVHEIYHLSLGNQVHCMPGQFICQRGEYIHPVSLSLIKQLYVKVSYLK